MFDLDAAVLAWRERVGRRSSLSQREVDELEDHLRARVGLEMELDGSLVPARAFALASEGLGDPAKLSKEFAKVGKLRWRRLMMAGWALFGVSFFLPALRSDVWYAGQPAFSIWGQILEGDRSWVLVVPHNVLMFMTFVGLRGARPKRMRWLAGLMAGYSAGALALGIGHVVISWGEGSPMGIGYWAYTASYICVAAGLWMCARGRAPAAAHAAAAEGG